MLEVLDLGATVHRLWVTGGDGVRRNVVLGHATAEEYLDSVDYVGGTIGRYANRIKDGRFPLDGQTVELATNERGNHLHGGPDGFHRRRVGRRAPHRRSADAEADESRGDQGFPGELIVLAAFETTGDSVRRAPRGRHRRADRGEPDQPRLLQPRRRRQRAGRGPGAPGRGRRLPARGRTRHPRWTPTRSSARPSTCGEPVRLGDVIAANRWPRPQLRPRRRPVLPPCCDSPATRTRLDAATDQPGLQVYSGGGLDGSRRSTTGQPYHRGAGLALEPQRFPDTPNRPEFGSAVLRPGRPTPPASSGVSLRAASRPRTDPGRSRDGARAPEEGCRWSSDSWAGPDGPSRSWDWAPGSSVRTGATSASPMPGRSSRRRRSRASPSTTPPTSTATGAASRSSAGSPPRTPTRASPWPPRWAVARSSRRRTTSRRTSAPGSTGRAEPRRRPARPGAAALPAQSP